MPQLVKKRRSGWTVLAAGALVASILAVGATPAAAAGEREPDQEATWRACLGPATADYGFTDVSASDNTSHYDNINCLAYYGISTGKTATTYDPDSHVTRSQMALFLTRMADVADIEIDDAMDAGFTDLGATGDDRVSAINRLANAGIMAGRTATTFDPTGYVTRADMALHLFAFLDLALDTVLIDRLPNSVEGNTDGTGHIELQDYDEDGIGTLVNDYYGDARRQVPAYVDNAIGAIYELGVTVAEVGEDGTFEPFANVSRAQMATFIMRTLGHTNLRPAGVTAQQTMNETLVSVRDADFAPIPDDRVEVIQANFPEHAFDADGECVSRFVSDFEPSFDHCRIDVGDAQTDGDGNVSFPLGSAAGNQLVIQCAADDNDDTPDTYTLMTGSRSSEADHTVWAWSGSLGDTVDDGTARYEAVDANTPTSRTEAAKAVLSGGSAYTVKMGRALNYTLQLADAGGNAVGPTPGADHSVFVTVEKTVAGTVVHRVTSPKQQPDSSGLITIPVTNPDPTPHGPNADDPDVDVVVTVSTSETNELPLVDMTMGAVYNDRLAQNEATGEDVIVAVVASGEMFSDNDPAATSIEVAPESSWRLISSSRNRNNVNISVLDQYGDSFRDTDYVVTANPSSIDDDGNTDTVNEGQVTGHLYNTGRRQLSYSWGGDMASAETIVVSGSDGTTALQAGDDDGPDSTIYWAQLATDPLTTGSGDGVPLLLGDAGTNHLLVSEDRATPAPVAYPYGDDDKFIVMGSVVSIDQFEEIITSALVSLDAAILTWDGYDYRRFTDDATWHLEGITCSEPAGGGD